MVTDKSGPVMRASLVTAFAAIFLTATPAFADFKVCNKTALAIRTAIGRFDGITWSSVGWWAIKPKDCVSLLTGALQARYYYLYASDGGTGIWEGRYHFCTAPTNTFNAEGRVGCAKRGFDSRGFFQVDTGQNQNWTQNLSN